MIKFLIKTTLTPGFAMLEPENYLSLFQKQKQYKFRAKNTSSRYRLGKLKAFKRLLLQEKGKVAAALAKDFGKPAVEADLTEIMPVLSMINLLERKLGSWMKDKKVRTPLMFAGSSSWVRHEGKGNCLVISPWNYPFQLAAYPILTAFSAGNTVMVKPSEFTPHTNKITAELFKEIFEKEEVAFFEGDASLSGELLKLSFDHIFFTGSTQVGKIVMEAAAKNLASVSLELGGKSPCLIDKGVDLEKACQKIAWGKMVNSGQTCVAPDYILVHKEDEEKVAQLLAKNIRKFYPGEDFSASKDYNQIITERHGRRLAALVQQAQSAGAQALIGGKFHEEKRIMEPTILTGVSENMDVMAQEIFGPVLPIVGVKDKTQMLEFINARDNALAMYIFSDDQKFCDECMDQTFNGGVTINDTLINVGHPLLPFGGAGKSGLGKYHGKYGFEEFSNLRAVVKRKVNLGADYFYPPYGARKTGVVNFLLTKLFRFF